jgi:putative transposon-encoded protein
LGALVVGEWFDVKVYFKNSLLGDGVTMIWVNGDLVFERTGQNVLRSGGGYAKIGMYTEIREDRTLYMDDVEISSSVEGSVAEWGSSDVVAIPESSTSVMSVMGLLWFLGRRRR